jgi:hypothetical protein
MSSIPLNAEQQWAKRFLWVNRVYLFYTLAVSSIVLMYVFAVFMGQDVSPDPGLSKRVFTPWEKLHCLGCVLTCSAYYTLWFHDPRIWANPDYNRVRSGRYWCYQAVTHAATLLLFFVEPYGIFRWNLFQSVQGIIFIGALLLPLIPFALAIKGFQLNRQARVN